MLIECYQDGHVTWKYHKDDHPTHLLQLAYILLHKDISTVLRRGKSHQYHPNHETISRQFLEYLEQRGVKNISEVQLNDVSLFIPFISKQYQPTSMRTVLAALRSFLKFVETKTLHHFTYAVPYPAVLEKRLLLCQRSHLKRNRNFLYRWTVQHPRGNAIMRCFTCTKNRFEIHRYRQPETG